MRATSTNCRIYPVDNGWMLKHRGTGGTADTIHALIIFYEKINKLTKDGGLSSD
jgi:hypothetical protein